jgi:acid phosphatase (class A)
MRGLILLALLPAAIASANAADMPRAPLLLDGARLDPALILPPPPAADSAEAREELDQLHAIDRMRTPAMIDAVKRDDHAKDATIFRAAIGPQFDLARLPATAALMAVVRREEKAAADRGKEHFRRNRPWIVLKDLHPCAGGDDEPWSSYPSGHTTMGYSMASILARLLPANAPAILARAADYARSRLICEVHFASDVRAGQALGMIVAERLMQEPSFRAQYEEAARELTTAGLR